MNQLLTQLNFQQIYFRGKRFDQHTIETAIDHLAKYLLKNIHSASPFILFTACNHIKSVVTYYAILKAGKIAVLIDPETKNLELDEIIKDVEPSAMITINEQLISFQYESEIIFRDHNRQFNITSDLTNVRTIAYTNAEDGYSKGAMLTEANLMYETSTMIKTNKLTNESITCALLHYSHPYGLIQGILAPTHSGATSLITQLNLLRINDTFKEIESFKVTHFYTVPSVYYILSKVPGIELLCQNVKEFYSGGIHLTSFISENFYKKTGSRIREGYGLTESSACAAYNYQDEGPIADSFGKPLPGCEMKIVKEDGCECRAKEIGEVCIKGEIVFQGYFNKEAATNSVLKNGWLFTGDFGMKDNDGFIYFCGLKKEMINVAGNKVYPKKLERLLKQNQNVANATIFSEASLLQGSIVGAQIRLHKSSKKTQEDLKNWCFQNINNTIVPKIWQFE